MTEIFMSFHQNLLKYGSVLQYVWYNIHQLKTYNLFSGFQKKKKICLMALFSGSSLKEA